MATGKHISTLGGVVSYLQSRLTGHVDRDAALLESIAVCERAQQEHAELRRAVTRLGKRLTQCTDELDRAIRGSK